MTRGPACAGQRREVLEGFRVFWLTLGSMYLNREYLGLKVPPMSGIGGPSISP